RLLRLREAKQGREPRKAMCSHLGRCWGRSRRRLRGLPQKCVSARCEAGKKQINTNILHGSVLLGFKAMAIGELAFGRIDGVLPVTVYLSTEIDNCLFWRVPAKFCRYPALRFYFFFLPNCPSTSLITSCGFFCGCC